MCSGVEERFDLDVTHFNTSVFMSKTLFYQESVAYIPVMECPTTFCVGRSVSSYKLSG